MRGAIRVVEDAFKERGLGRVQMPSKSYLFFKRYKGDLRVMPAFIDRMNAAGVKVVNSHPENPRIHGLPSVIGTLVLIDPASGMPMAIMAANVLTAVRTGAAGAVAAKYLARTCSEVVGIVGAGVQAHTQLLGLGQVLEEIREVKVYDKDAAKADAFVSGAWPAKWSIQASPNSEEVVRKADVLVTTTPSRSPIIKRSWVSSGIHINAIGADAPGKQELDVRILQDSKVVVDDWEQASHGGELNRSIAKGIITREDIHGDLGDVVSGKLPGRESDFEITVFDSTGLAIQDMAVAAHIYERAMAEDKGIEIDIWEK